MKKISRVAIACFALSFGSLTVAHAREGGAPEGVQGKTIVIDFSNAKTREGEGGAWEKYEGEKQLVFTFKQGNSYKPLTGKEAPPAGYENIVRYKKTSPNRAELYHGEWEGGVTYTLFFTYDKGEPAARAEGRVTSSGACEGTEWEMEGATFVMTDSAGAASASPSANQAGNAAAWDAVIARLGATTYRDAYLKTLQKRLMTALPAIRDGADINMVIPDANGTTALHNACGLGDVELVKWLLEQGADVKAKTAKGASVSDCVGRDRDGKIGKLLRQYMKK